VAPSPACVSSTLVVGIFPGIEGSLPVVLLQGPKNFLPVFRWPATIRVNVVNVLGCVLEVACVLPASIVSNCS
jgi:hypothetical protein